MRQLLLAAAIAVLAWPAIAAQSAAPATLTADEVLARDIMAKVATNQDRTEAARTHYIYMQHIRAVSRKPGGKVMCEEITDSRVSPRAKGSHQELLTLDGRYWQKGRYVHYTTLQEHETAEPKGTEPKGTDAKQKEAKTEKEDLDGLDIDLVENLRKNLTNDGSADTENKGQDSAGHGVHVHVDVADEGQSKDGLAKGLFPLTTKQQEKYLFKLEGQQRMNGRDVYRVSFRPKDKNDFDWKGEAYIDVHEFEPVVVYTQMSRKIPLAVRTLLGTNLPGLGFSVTYDREPDGVWFPVSFGTEFRMRVLFFLARDISMSLSNAHFEKTHADVRILDGVKVVENAAPASTSPATTH
jgi:hypothetical protein